MDDTSIHVIFDKTRFLYNWRVEYRGEVFENAAFTARGLHRQTGRVIRHLQKKQRLRKLQEVKEVTNAA